MSTQVTNVTPLMSKVTNVSSPTAARSRGSAATRSRPRPRAPARAAPRPPRAPRLAARTPMNRCGFVIYKSTIGGGGGSGRGVGAGMLGSNVREMRHRKQPENKHQTCRRGQHDATTRLCPLSTRGGTRLVRLVQGRGGWAGAHCAEHRQPARAGRPARDVGQQRARPREKKAEPLERL
jgi:hypothetical protein